MTVVTVRRQEILQEQKSLKNGLKLQNRGENPRFAFQKDAGHHVNVWDGS